MYVNCQQKELNYSLCQPVKIDYTKQGYNFNLCFLEPTLNDKAWTILKRNGSHKLNIVVFLSIKYGFWGPSPNFFMNFLFLDQKFLPVFYIVLLI